MKSDPVHVHVESVGIGPPLVLLPGFAMHGGLFASILPALAKRRRVHVVDLPGHGHSPAIAPFDLASLAAAIDTAIESGQDRLAVLGWSLIGLMCFIILGMVVLVVWGARDRFFPLSHAHRAATLIPRSVLRIIPESGHSPNWERPAEVAALLAGFFRA